MADSKGSAKSAAQKTTGYSIQDKKLLPIETKLDQLLSQTETIVQDQIDMKDILTELKYSVREIRDYTRYIEKRVGAVEIGLEELKQQEYSTASNDNYVHKRSKRGVMVGLGDRAQGTSLSASSSATKLEAPKTPTTMRSEIKQLVLNSVKNQQAVADGVYKNIVQQVQKICNNYRETSNRYKKTDMWKDVNKDTQDKLVQEIHQAILNNDKRAIFLNDCADYWPVRFLVQQRWDGWTYYAIKKEKDN